MGLFVEQVHTRKLVAGPGGEAQVLLAVFQSGGFELVRAGRVFEKVIRRSLIQKTDSFFRHCISGIWNKKGKKA